jgi:hypothetical protein
MHPSKQVFPILQSQENQVTLAIGLNPTFTISSYTEMYVCPFCSSLEFTEFIESQPEISSVKSVPLEEVDNWLKQGYKVRELYAKSATLVLMEAKQA